jgi:hypothetical protein
MYFRCDTPLVRKKVRDDEQMFCVGCSLPVMKESSLNKKVVEYGDAENGRGAILEGMAACDAGQQQSTVVECCRMCVEETSMNVARCMSRLSAKLTETSDAEMKYMLDCIQSCAAIVKDLHHGVV